MTRQKKLDPIEQTSREVLPNCVGTSFVAPMGSPSIPYAISFCKEVSHGHLMATACEDGFVTVLDSSCRLPYYVTGEDGAMPRAHWKAHSNAIFDIVWSKGDSSMITTSGERMEFFESCPCP